MTEQLYDGPCDGLEVVGAGPVVTRNGSVYERRIDGRLYLKGSKWDLLPRKNDRL